MQFKYESQDLLNYVIFEISQNLVNKFKCLYYSYPISHIVLLSVYYLQFTVTPPQSNLSHYNFSRKPYP